MRWRVEIDPRAESDLDRIPAKDRIRILEFLRDRVAAHPDPRALAKRLSGAKHELSRFRVGDYRLIVRFIGSRMVVLVVSIGNRRDVYR